MNYEKPDFPALNLRTLTFVDILKEHASHCSNNPIFTFISDGENKKEKMTYSELDQKARKIAGFLQSRNLKGKRALLLFPPGLQYIEGFFGCLYAGVIAVPAYPPSPAALERSLPRLETISKDADASIVLTTEKIMSLMQIYFRRSPENAAINKAVNKWNESNAAAAISSMNWAATDSQEILGNDKYKEELISPDSIAFLQYTSGSTRSPRGVMVSHGNLVHNSAVIKEAFGISGDKNECVMWLPFYHDMGLIGGILQPVYSGMATTLMSTLAFLSWPQRWLQIISSIKNKMIISGGPNFAYELCLRKLSIEQIESLDLSRWDIAFSGAEPVRADTLEAFSKVFEPAGFRPQAFFPCYGMAETTLFVTGRNLTGAPVIESFDKKSMQGRMPEKSAAADNSVMKLVGCGSAGRDLKVAIVDPDTGSLCRTGQVGEIWISGPSVAKGYWRKDNETEKAFFAYTTDTNEGPFLKSGDIGFLDENNELFVTGRLKDLIIIRGKNFYPQDIEHTAERSHHSLRVSCVAAFSVEEEREERLVIVQEVQSGEPNLDEVISNIRQAVSEEHDIQAYSVVLIKAKTILKTSSGKIQRQAIKNQYLEGSLNIVKESRLDQTASVGNDGNEEELNNLTFNIINDPDVSDIRKWLIHILSSILKLNIKTIAKEKSFAGFGMDSLMTVELKNDIESKLGVNISISDLFENTEYSLLAEKIYKLLIQGKHNKLQPVIPVMRYRNESPLSYGQKSLWFMQQLEPENAAYNIFFAVRIQSDLDIKALKKSFDIIIEKHASLRTTYHNSESGPYQKIHEKSSNYFTEINCSNLNETEINEKIVCEAHKPFDLSKGPVFRVTLFKSPENKYILLINLHHIAVDLWSIVLMLSELRNLYPAFKNFEKPELTFCDLQYTDYVRWQSKFLEGLEGEKSFEYWKDQLSSGELPKINLPLDKKRPQTKTYKGSVFSFQVASKITRGIKKIAGDENSTLYIALLAAFNILLNRYTHQEEIIVGSPAAGRNRPELENIVGYFVNSMVIKSKVSENNSFREYLRGLRKVVLDALDHQDYPFPLLVEKLKHYREASRSPLFDIMFVLERPHLLKELGLAELILADSEVKLNLGGLKLESYPIEQKSAQFDLTLSVVEKGDSLSALFQFNTDLFEVPTIRQMAEHFKILLKEISNNADRKIGDYSLTSSNEMNILLNQWNSAVSDFIPDRFIHKMFQSQVRLTPEASAIISKEKQTSYSQLNKMSNRIAHLLKQNGVQSETTVGIYSIRSIEMIAGLIGILKSGGTYVPLDPEYPDERIEFMIKDAGVSVVLVQKEFASRIEESGQKVIILEDAFSDESLPEDDLQINIYPESTAYIIYTSGSTGKPKGVMVPHSALGNHCLKIRDYYCHTAKDRVLQFSSMNFDASLEQIFTTLITGASLVLRDEELWNAGIFLKKLKEDKLTVINLPPSYFEQLTHEWCRYESPDFQDLRLVIIGGDVVHFESIKKWYSMKTGHIRLINAYGPTETTITSITGEISPDMIEDGERILPIGRPQANRKVYVLDANGNVVPTGVTGELFIGGQCLADRYNGHADLTAERFIPDRFSIIPGQRLYKTGDLVRYQSQGSLEFLGRVDYQVKIRGFRVELGEIETVLNEHPSVKNAVSVLTPDGQDEKKIIVYLELQKPCHVSELRAYLSRKLPDYLIPSSFILLDKLPMTPAGKIDRQALPAPVENSRQEDQSEAFVAPRTPVEKNIAEIIEDVLNISSIGLYDNFFEMGGHSLLAIKVLSRINDFYKTDLSLKKLFEAPNVAGLANAIVLSQIDLENSDVSQVLSDIEHLSEDEVNRMLNDET